MHPLFSKGLILFPNCELHPFLSTGQLPLVHQHRQNPGTEAESTSDPV